MGTSQDSLACIRQLFSELNRLREEEVNVKLQAQEKQCKELHMENSKLLEAMGEVPQRSGPGSAFEQMEKEYVEERYAHGEASLSSRRGAGSHYRSTAHTSSQRHRGSAVPESSYGDGLEPHDAESTGHTESTGTGNEGRHAGRNRPASGTSFRKTAPKPFVVSSGKSHHVQSSLRGSRPQAPEDAEFAKTAMRYAQNAQDKQAVAKLAASLKLQRSSGGGQQPADIRSSDHAASQDLHQTRFDEATGAPGSGPSSGRRGMQQSSSSMGRGWST